MATIAATVSRISKHKVKITYASALTEADDGAPVDLSAFGVVKALSLVGAGTFGTGGRIDLEGSLDSDNYTGIRKITGSAIQLSAAGEEVSNEPYTRVRANIGAGTGVSVTAEIIAIVGS